MPAVITAITVITVITVITHRRCSCSLLIYCLNRASAVSAEYCILRQFFAAIFAEHIFLSLMIQHAPGKMCIYMITYSQLSWADGFADCKKIYDYDNPAFMSFPEKHIDLDEIIHASFRKHFYA